ncbi:MAG: hypothetical protein ACI86H_000049 [bacterium]|jgi:hypothetical protein
MKKVLLILLLLCSFSLSSLHAQVVTPSLDPTQLNIIPTSISWRFGNTIGGSYSTGTGSYKPAGVTTDDITHNGWNALMAFQPGQYTIELSQAVDEFSYKDSTSDGYTATTKNVMLALRGLDFISLGINQKINTTEYNSRTEKVKQTTTGASLSFRFWDHLYIGGGVERVVENQSDLVKNTWENNYYGIALMGGRPKMNRFRIEYAIMTSNSSTEATEGSLGANTHNGSQTVYQSVEFVFGAMLFAYRKDIKTENTETTGSTSVSDTVTTIDNYGIGWLSDSGWILNFYKVDWKKEQDSTVSSLTTTSSLEGSSWKVSFGYNFF